MAANKHRGEVAITLGGKTYRMRPSFEAMAAFEEATGRGTLALARMAATGDIGMAKAAAIIGAALRAGGQQLDTAEVGRLVFAEGLPTVLPPVVAFLSNCLTGGIEPGEAKAADAATG